jgi:hypothetical protein
VLLMVAVRSSITILDDEIETEFAVSVPERDI